MYHNLEDIMRESTTFVDYYRRYSDYLHRLLTAVDPLALERVIQVFLEARDRGASIYFAGNGGSAATADHFAQDLAELGHKLGVPGFRSQSLACNVAHITAAANDYGFDQVFVDQMRFLFQAGDVLVVISGSGNSPNVVEAVKLARERGGVTVALLGFDGGALAGLAQHTVIVRTPRGEYFPVEDVHMAFDHVMVSFLTRELKNGR